MKKILLMFVVLITSITNAQNTFAFRCIPAEELAIAAIYEAEYPPSSLDESINSAANAANYNAAATVNKSRTDFISAFDNYGLVFTQFNQNAGGYVVQYADSAIPDIQIPGGGTNLTNAAMQAWALEIAKVIWHYGHPNYVAPTLFEEELTAIYGASTPPTELGSVINDAALAVEYGIAGNTPRKNFMESLAYFNVTVSNIFDSNSGPSEAHLSNGNVVPNIGTNANTSSMTPAQFAVFAFEVVKRFWHIGHPTYAADQAKAQLRAERTETVKMLGNDNVDVRVSLDTVEGNIIGISDTDGEQYIYVQLYDLSNQTGFVGLEDLEEGEFTLLKNAITAKVNELTPTVAKELAAWFDDTVNAPTGAAPDYLPTALYAKANTLTNGTERLDYITGGLLSTHGVTITRGGLGQTGATNTTFILSKGEGYDVIFDWGAYSSNGFNGNNNASPELYRNLVFDVIVAGWKLINNTHNTKRSDWLDQDLDTNDVDVILVTYADDWWIYFNNTDTPILSGGRPLDPMYHNKFTLNPHDAHMTEAEFQRLVVFVTYMRDNYTRLKQIDSSSLNRHAAISNMVETEFGATISSWVQNTNGTYHYTFEKNGNSNMYPLQSNWTHPEWVKLSDLSPDNWVKFYAKARGILIGL